MWDYTCAHYSHMICAPYKNDAYTSAHCSHNSHSNDATWADDYMCAHNSHSKLHTIYPWRNQWRFLHNTFKKYLKTLRENLLFFPVSNAVFHNKRNFLFMWTLFQIKPTPYIFNQFYCISKWVFFFALNKKYIWTSF